MRQVDLDTALANPVPYYLSACLAYEVFDTPIMSDATFDALGRHLHDHWDGIEHPHKHLIDRESCHYTSGLTLPYVKWPGRIAHATAALIRRMEA